MKKIFVSLFALVSLASCTHNAKVEILENGSTTVIGLSPEEYELIKSGYFSPDTVWVNLDTHRIDDTCNTAMKAVIRSKF